MINHTNVGIDAFSFDIPKLYLPISELAKARDIEVVKLEKGLGLSRMSFPDIHQDVVVFAANALKKLIEQENLNPKEIARLYIGSESGVDAAKPIASYLLPLMEEITGEGSWRHCDAVDLTFACIGGVDAMENCIDFVRLHPQKKAIVICTDFAKYDLNSTGEYTQGAGAIAMLISSCPQIISFDGTIAVSTQGVFDFFKPKRTLSKKAFLDTNINSNPEWFGVLESEIKIFKEQPVFDGQYSNSCYQNRLKEAYFQLKEKLDVEGTLYQNWKNIIAHLPYAFQGRRMFSEIYALDSKLKELLPNFNSPEYAEKLKEISKSKEYKVFIEEKFAPAEIASSKIGNMYTGSLFMGLLSTLYHYYNSNVDIKNEKFGFLAYGSGSKSKAFEGIIKDGWKKQIEKIKLFETLEKTHSISIETYNSLHKKECRKSIIEPKEEYVLYKIEDKNPLLMGARYYMYKK